MKPSPFEAALMEFEEACADRFLELGHNPGLDTYHDAPALERWERFSRARRSLQEFDPANKTQNK
jgi:hypothetical protein